MVWKAFPNYVGSSCQGKRYLQELSLPTAKQAHFSDDLAVTAHIQNTLLTTGQKCLQQRNVQYCRPAVNNSKSDC